MGEHDCESLAADRRGRRQPGHRPGRAAARAGRPGDRPVDPPGTHQPGRSRHQPDAGRARRRRSPHSAARRTDFGAVGTRGDPPGHAHGGPYPHPARGAHHIRRQGGRLVERRRRRLRAAAARWRTPVQIGGAVGTWSATTELATLLTGAAGPGGGRRRRGAEHRNHFGLGYSAAVAHHPDAGHRGRGRLRRLHRLLGPHRLGRRHPGSPGDRRTERAGHRKPRRIVLDAAQAQSGVVHPDPAGRRSPHRSWPRPCTPPPRWPTTNDPTARGMPNGTPCAPWPAGPSSRVPSAASCWPGWACTPRRWPKTSVVQMFSVSNGRSPTWWESAVGNLFRCGRPADRREPAIALSGYSRCDRQRSIPLRTSVVARSISSPSTSYT